MGTDKSEVMRNISSTVNAKLMYLKKFHIPRRMISRHENIVDMAIPCRECTSSVKTSCSQANRRRISKTCNKSHAVMWYDTNEND